MFQKVLQLKIRKKKKKKKPGLKGVVKFFSVDFNPIDTNDITTDNLYNH